MPSYTGAALARIECRRREDLLRYSGAHERVEIERAAQLPAKYRPATRQATARAQNQPTAPHEQ